MNTAGNLKNVVEKPAKYKYEIVSVKSNLLTAQNVLKLHLSGKRVLAWTVNDPAEITRLRQIGVDGVITDDPTLVHGD